MRTYRYRGVSITYAAILMVALCAMFSLAMDLGRVQLAKTELHRTADSASRAAAAGLMVDPTEAMRQARWYAGLNRVDGLPLSLDINQDVELGRWDANTRKFHRMPGMSMLNADAVRVVARKSSGRGDGVPLMFAGFLGMSSCDVSAESISILVPPIDVDQSVPATANPFLAGMPKGSSASETNPHNSPDYAGNAKDPRQSPLDVNLRISEGQTLTFDSINGTTRHDPKLDYFQPDGELADIGHNNLSTSSSSAYDHTFRNQNGIADVRAPINALVGVFLDEKQPDKSPAPTSNLDFSTPTSRDFTTLTPELKQIFFIGDGLNSDGVRQEFVAPKGATRLFLATWDFYEWNNNYGFRDVKVIRPMRIVTVK